MTQETIQYQVINWQNYTLPIAYNENGLLYVGIFNETVEEMKEWFDSVNRFLWQESQEITIYEQQLLQYLNKERKQFDFTIQFVKGTPFQQAVWHALCRVPYGETSNYTRIAQAVERDKAVRATGTAIGMNPLSIVVPCHRILTKAGRIGGYRGGLEMKRLLLKIEGK